MLQGAWVCALKCQSGSRINNDLLALADIIDAVSDVISCLNAGMVLAGTADIINADGIFIVRFRV